MTDTNNISRDLIILSLKQIPEVGGLLSGLCSALWPIDKEDVWGEIKQKVELLIDAKISAAVYQSVQEDLIGIKKNLDDYSKMIEAGSNLLEDKWVFIHSDFLQQLPHFQSKGYEILLLPLFTQFANLHLSLLRDGIINGKQMGFTDNDINFYRTTLTYTITSYKEWVNKTYYDYLQVLQSKTASNKHKTEPFQTINKFKREITFTVLDYMNLWDYFDVTLYPDSVEVYLDREVYSDAFGTSDDSAFIVSGNPKSFPKQINVWGWDRIDAVEVIYKDSEGPLGVTTTGRMGDKSGGSNQPPHGGQFLVENNPVVKVEVSSGSIINSMILHFSDGTVSNMLGGNYTYAPGDNHIVQYDDHYLSSIKIMGVSHYYGSADCVVLGFKLKK
jgi:hypothetical protein